MMWSARHSLLLLAALLSSEQLGSRTAAARHRGEHARRHARNASAVSAEEEAEKPKAAGRAPSYRWVCSKLELTGERRQRCLETLGSVAVTDTRERRRMERRRRWRHRESKRGK